MIFLLSSAVSIPMTYSNEAEWQHCVDSLLEKILGLKKALKSKMGFV